MSINVAIVLAAIAAAGFNVSMAFMKTAAQKLPKLTFPLKRGALRAFLKSGQWMGCFGLMVLSWGLYLAALANAPISIVQPLLGMGLAVLAVFSVFYLKERLAVGEWLGIATMIVGLVLMGISAEKHEAGSVDTINYPWLIILSAGLLTLVGLAYIIEKKKPGFFNLELILGAAGGILVGVAALFTRPMMLEVKADNDGVFAVLLVVVIVLNITGIIVQQGGFQRGRAMTVVAILAVLNKVIAVVGGFLVLGEALPDDKVKAGLRISALGCLLVGTWLLSRFGKPPQKKTDPEEQQKASEAAESPTS
jgi:drug/metabolite transporter (DMT)-like permease